jgi:hypothetical protein
MEAEKDASHKGAKHAKFGKLFLSLRSWRLGGINSVEVALFNILKVRIESGVRDSTLVGKNTRAVTIRVFGARPRDTRDFLFRDRL